MSSSFEKGPEKAGEWVSTTPHAQASSDGPYEEGEIIENTDHLHRRLGNRQIQLMSIGGTIGTAVFVSMGGALFKAGPISLLLAYSFYSCFLLMVNNGLAEMTVLYPVSGGFVRLAGHFVDEAFGFMAGYNFFLYEALIIPFEITALTTVLGFWSDDIPGWAVPLACIILYGLLNVLAVKWFGEAEFWLSGGKVILIFLVFFFTFFTMCGANPQRDAYGFRHWKNEPFKEYRTTGGLGKFEGFLAAIWSASFTVTGPEYISMVAGEARRPRVYIKEAFKTVYWRFPLFFVGSAVFIGLVLSCTDPTLTAVLTGTTGGHGTAAASPYVIAMENLGVNGLPHLVSALLCTSIFSAGNTYTFCATRSLYGLAIEGRAPKVFRYCTKGGVPIVCFAFVMIFPCISLLQIGSGSSVVLGWLINLVTAGGVINYIVMAITYVFFHRACTAQGLDRKTLPYCGWFQPYSAYIGGAWMIVIVFTYGYSSFQPFSVSDFFIYYTLLILAPVTYFSWKLIHRTKIIKPLEADLVWERPTIDAYEQTFIDPPLTFWGEMLGPLRKVIFKKSKDSSDRQASIVA